MAAITGKQLDQFYDQGYLVVENILDIENDLDPLVREYEVRLDELIREQHRAGNISSAYADLPFRQRLTRLYAETGRDWAQYFDFTLPLRDHIRLDEPCFFGPSIFHILRSQDILDVIELMIGPEIYSNPVQHVRIKPPERLVPHLKGARVKATPWHQDAGVILEEADRSEIITVWLPIFEATVENGCLRVAPRSHRRGLLEHCPAQSGRYLSTKLFDADRAVALPMKRGSALFMTRMTPHSSLPNNSDGVRWSMDMRYNATGQPTGRPEFPGFVARSRSDPDSELRDPVAWERSWLEARERLALEPTGAPLHRSWTGDGCA